jgi:hypothetical protein
MIDFGRGAVAEPLSSNSFRDAILSRHDALRGVLAETVDFADARTSPGTDIETLRAVARRLYRTLEEQLTFEDLALTPALRDVIGWGSVLREQIERDHLRQREALAAAFLALEPGSMSYAELADEVRAFAGALLRDLESEDEALLNASLDAIATDSEGG